MTERDELWAGRMVEREELWEGLDALDRKPMEMIPIVAAAIKQMRELGADEEQIAKMLAVAADELRAVAGVDQATGRGALIAVALATSPRPWRAADARF